MTQEIITFENNKYEWKDLPGQGKCLVPYKEPEFLKGLTKGNVVVCGDYEVMVSIINAVYHLIITRCKICSNCRGGTLLRSSKTMEELKGIIKSACPSAYMITL